jgi:hypothetical protein
MDPIMQLDETDQVSLIMVAFVVALVVPPTNLLLLAYGIQQKQSFWMLSDH